MRRPISAQIEKIALFIDGANLYATAKSLGFDIDYKRLLREFQSRGYLVRAFYYTAVIEDQEYSLIRPLIDWLDYNGYSVVTISKGKKDRRKHDALYVRIGAKGEVCSTPAVITDLELERELERAKRYRGCVSGAQRGEDAGFSRRRFDKVIEAFTLLFESERRHAVQSDRATG